MYVCMGSGQEEDGRRRRGAALGGGVVRAVLLLLLLPSPLGAPERATDRSYASHPSMSSELLLSSVSLLSLPLPLSPLLPLPLPGVHQFVCRSHTTFRRRPEERANESERTHDELDEGKCGEGAKGEGREEDDMQR